MVSHRSKCTVNEKALMNAIDVALADTSMGLTAKINKNLTPRNKIAPPKNLDAPVTGNLKRSIKRKKKSWNEYRVGQVYGGPEYGVYQEFGTRYMKPRSFLRRGLVEYHGWITKNIRAVMQKEIDNLAKGGTVTKRGTAF